MPSMRCVSAVSDGWPCPVLGSDWHRRARYHRLWDTVCVVLACQLFLCIPTLWAQQAQLATERGPHYVDEPVLVRVTVEGFAAEPQPTCTPDKMPSGAQLQSGAVSPNVSSFTQIINGKMTQYSRATFNFDFYVIASQPGTYDIGPFTVSQHGTQVKTRTVAVQIETVPTDSDMRVALVLPTTPVYLGQRVPVEVQWWYAGDVESVRNLSIRSALFDQFTFIDTPPERGEQALPIETAKGTLRLKASVSQKRLDNRTFLVLSASRTLVADKADTYDIAPITAGLDKVTQWGYDIFRQRRPVATARYRAVGEALQFVVQPLPQAGRPASFGGAVGKGFALEAAADRTVVQVGDPIALTLTLRGDGNLEHAGLGDLAGEGGLDPHHFRLPDGDITGQMKDGAKQFTVLLRVTDVAVAQIPAITYAWFDPDIGAYQTTESKPIALQVLAAHVVGAQEVVSAAPPSSGNGETSTAQTSQAPQPAAAAAPRQLNVTGANLAIVRDPQRLLRNEAQRFGGLPVQIALHLSSVLLIVVALVRRKAAAADPAIVARRSLLRNQAHRIRAAATLTAHEAAAQIAAALRAIAVEAGDEQRRELEQILIACENLVYAPGGAAGQEHAELSRRALAVVDAVARSQR